MSRKLFTLLFVVFAVVAMSSCQKEVLPAFEVPVTDAKVLTSAEAKALTDQAKTITALNVAQAQKLLTAKKSKSGPLSTAEVDQLLAELKSELNLKSAKTDVDPDEEIIVNVFKQDSKTYLADGMHVTMYSIYWVTDYYGNTLEKYTLIQIYGYKDGKLDTSSFQFDFEFGSINNVILTLDKVRNVYNLTCYFRGNDKKQFYFNLNQNSNEVILPPLADGKWQIQGVTGTMDNQDLEFMTDLIDCYSSSNIIPIMIKLKNPNILSYVEIPKNLFKGVGNITLIGRKLNSLGQWQTVYLDHKVLYTDELPEITLYGAPFDIDEVAICGRNGCWFYSTKAIRIEGNLTIFGL